MAKKKAAPKKVAKTMEQPSPISATIISARTMPDTVVTAMAKLVEAIDNSDLPASRRERAKKYLKHQVGKALAI